MVKAIKRKPGKATVSSKEKKKSFLTSKVMVLLFLVLFAGGWMVGGYMSLGGGDKQQTPQISSQQPEFGIGNFSGTEVGTIGERSKNLAIFGQLEVPLNLKERLSGDLYLLDGGASYLVLTNKTRDDVISTAAGSYIVYDIASCGGFDCLLDNKTDWSNVTAPSFDVYNLNVSSEFLTTNRVGFPIQ
jgi:hypothetical protein